MRARRPSPRPRPLGRRGMGQRHAHEAYERARWRPPIDRRVTTIGLVGRAGQAGGRGAPVSVLPIRSTRRDYVRAARPSLLIVAHASDCE
jgi:hypothetical protein